jgi:hypothetical protein
LLPVLDFGLEALSREPPPLPAGEVLVLDRQLRKRRGPARPNCLVEGAELAQEHGDRPAVRDDVVQGQEDHVLAEILAQHGEAGQGTPL